MTQEEVSNFINKHQNLKSWLAKGNQRPMIHSRGMRSG